MDGNRDLQSGDDIRTLFSLSMSRMYKAEVPQYGDLMDLVAEVNAEVRARDPRLDARLVANDEVARLDLERHGAIRLGTAEELANMRRLFAVMGMAPVGYYDLSVAGVPVHSTAFRPVNDRSLRRNPFRVFTSLLRLELLADEALRAEAAAILARRAIFTPACLDLIATAEQQGGLTVAESERFVAEALETFRWHREATVGAEVYQRLKQAHPLVADVVCFKGPHINHLTPRTLDIDVAQVRMAQRGLSAKAVIEGGPARRVPILLRQTSFKALEEPVNFVGPKGAAEEGAHTARFGEIEQRGVALTPKGRALYDRLLDAARGRAPVRAGADDAAVFMAELTRQFEAFPDNEDALRRAGLAYFRYMLTEVTGELPSHDLEALIAAGRVRAEPIIYEDFLPVSAAGIFQSNLGDDGQAEVVQNANQVAFEAALGCAVVDPTALYAAAEAASIKAVRLALRLEDAPKAAPKAEVASLRAVFSGRLLTHPDDIAPFLVDWRGQWRGAALAVAQPDSTEDVAAIVRWCARTATPIVPQGGNTGLSGGAIPDGGGRALVLSLSRLNKIRAIDLANNTMTVEAGCILQAVQEAAAGAGRLFPLSLAAQGSATIGGNLATNAGGTAVLRYGNARQLCLGLEVVTAQGEVWNGLRGLRKDNTGYDLRDLYIGSEGALGVITAAVLQLHPAPAGFGAALLAVQSPHQALAVLQMAQARLGGALTGFELMSGACMDLVLACFPDARSPFQAAAPWYALIEITALVDEARATVELEALLEAAFEAGVLTDAVVASSTRQRQELWALRENIAEAQQLSGKAIKHDVSVPISVIGDFIDEVEPQLTAGFPGVRPMIFGHLGDGNLHFNVSQPASQDAASFMALEGPINRLVHDAVARCGGSISAEHGLGVLRRDEAARYRPAVETALMQAIKQALDPLGIMNPGKVIAPTAL